MSCQHESPQRLVTSANQPLLESLHWLEEDLGAIRSDDLFRPVRVRLGRQSGTVTLNDLQLINFGSNDYLGYAGDSRLIKASAKGACSEGAGAGASPLVSGHSALHESLGQNISSLLDTEETLIFPSGYAANTSTIACLTGPHDLIVSDAHNHASIIDGCRLSGANVQIYPHRNITEAANLLRSIPARRRLIVTDSLFSMDGTIAPLADMAQLAHDTKSMLLVDEAHATGLFGIHGSGLVEETGIASSVAVRIGTLSKALGSSGGFVSGHRTLVDYLRHRARSWMFSTAHPPASAAAAIQAIKLLSEEPFRRKKLTESAALFRQKLLSHGVDIGDAEAHVVPVFVKTPQRAVQIAASLVRDGFFVPAIRPPSVPTDSSLLRVSLSYIHTQDTIDSLSNSIIKYVCM
ncbi:MAG: 8-amino-7-oxononanoate synthase [Planctomycetes bacterium]|nr:8-amino-7-oxononanoate synthase [Planctomycetota bacterium]MBL6910677.1 8-amino-7-oxononanoate synthase [Pirellulales bacterium]RZO63997.1 MAG: 8-amino-7-oxononanoate synthase [Phycisphaeraceae bacterium]HAO72620.1 8-amino-7-oxononanoate synthase [Planctomycetaceae bacterium]|tara:strand:+ start:931 stop:2148 length:1218 start_codon:yes stop_codon:yes gene_type:complete